MSQITQPTGSQPATKQDLSSVAMAINGTYIEDMVDGYKTLNVKGREPVSYNIETAGKDNRSDGVRITSRTMQQRVLEIEYMLSAPDNRTFQQQFRQLVSALKADEPGDQTYYFKDDDTIEYHGQLQEMDDVPETNNTVTSTFKIYCQDPAKYTRNNTASTYGARTTIDDDTVLSPYEIRPEEIRVTSANNVSLSGKNLTISHKRSGRQIIFDFDDEAGSLGADDTLIIDINNNAAYKQGNKSANFLKFLRYEETDFHSFKVKLGDEVTVNKPFEVSIVARGEWR